jgi:serine/threonine protein kinase
LLEEIQLMSLHLVVIAGPDQGKALLLHPGQDLMLGRGPNAYYRLNDPRVSRNHCQLVRDGDQVTVLCGGGSGGTLVNGKAVKKQPLKIGDILQVGDTQLRLQVGDVPPNPGRDRGQAAPTPAPGLEQLEALSGQQLGHYDVGPVIGTGSSSVVFHATDTKDSRPVALKVLRPEFSRDEKEKQRFVWAMKTMLPLRHANLVALHAAGKTGPHCWVAMEYLAGENMTQVIGRTGVAGMLDWRYGLKVAVHVGRALDYAHGQGILHRNVTPTNILLEAPTKTIKLGDLMLAKALEDPDRPPLTNLHELVGDVTYMSPERTDGTGAIDGRADLYGLGATLYALLTGRPPCTGATLVEKILSIRQNKPEKPTKFHLSIPARFEGMVLRLLAKDPADRYATAADLLADLERVGKLHGVTV